MWKKGPFSVEKTTNKVQFKLLIQSYYNEFQFFLIEFSLFPPTFLWFCSRNAENNL